MLFWIIIYDISALIFSVKFLYNFHGLLPFYFMSKSHKLFSVLKATYAPEYSTECLKCPAGFRCPDNTKTEACPFSTALGFSYSTDTSKDFFHSL